MNPSEQTASLVADLFNIEVTPVLDTKYISNGRRLTGTPRFVHACINRHESLPFL